MSMSLRAACLASAIAAVALAGHARAGTVYSQGFNDPAFQGAPILVQGSTADSPTSDRWGPTNYYGVNSVDGWSFTGGAYYATQVGGGDGPVRDAAVTDGAILLNENGATSARVTVTGLTAGHGYDLSFLQWGDNRPGESYVGTVAVDGVTLLTYNGVDAPAGSLADSYDRSVAFTAQGTSATIVFGQASTSEASPIIDDVTVATAGRDGGIPAPEPASLAMFAAGLLGLGLARRWRTA